MQKSFSNEEGRQSGVYCIVHKPTGKIYIGSAVCLNRRYNHHIWYFKNKSNSPYLQRSYDKNKSDDFSMEILEFVFCKEDLISVEQKWIDIYFDYQNKCYNISPTAGNCLGVKASKEKKYKLSVMKKRLWASNSGYRKRMLNLAYKRRIKYKLVSPNNIVHEGVGLEKFCKEHGLHVRHMSAVLRGDLKSYKGWRTIKNINYEFDRKKLCKKLAQNRAAKYDVKLLSPDGVVLGPIINLKQFCEQYNLHRVSVRKLIKKQISQTKGWKLINE